jgi:transposase/transposase-like protein
MRKAPSIVLSEEDQATLEQWSRGRRISVRQALRARIVLLAAAGVENREIAERLGTSRPTVGLWRRRFAQSGVAGIERDAPRGGRPPKKRQELVAEILRKTTQEKPRNATHWTTRTLALELGTNPSLVQRVWKANGLKPHLTRTFKLSTDPRFEEKLLDVVGLYLNPPEHALVLCADEKSQIQALDRTQPGLPLKRGRAGTMTHDYKRHGTTTLFAALNLADGTVIARCEPRHRHQEWLRFLRTIDRETPRELDLHLIVDNYATHKHEKVQAWLSKRPRFHLHFIPTSSSWLNAVESFFAPLTSKRLRRGVFMSVADLIDAIKAYIDQNNAEPKPLIWTATADSILEKVGRARVALNKARTA